jgi:hypothetical protein
LNQYEKHFKEPRVSEKNDAKAQIKPWRLAVPFTVIAAGFYAQGRAYYEGYLDYFGLSSSQFPVSTTDAYWEALKGWMLLVSKGVPAVWSAYPQYLKTMWQPMLAVLAMLALLWLAGRLGWRNRLRVRQQVNETKTKFSARHLALAGSAMLVWILSVPLLVMAAMFAIALFIVGLIAPFDGLGHVGAQRSCETEASRVPLVHFVGDDRLGANGKGLPPARLLQCGADFCALIRDGEAFVISRQSVQRTDGVSLMSGARDAKRNSGDKTVPSESQLCYKPKQSA